MIGYKTGVILSGNMRSLFTTKIIVFKWCVYYIIVFFLGNYEFSPHTVYPAAGGLVVNTLAYHTGDPGSIPGRGGSSEKCESI